MFSHTIHKHNMWTHILRQSLHKAMLILQLRLESVIKWGIWCLSATLSIYSQSLHASFLLGETPRWAHCWNPPDENVLGLWAVQASTGWRAVVTLFDKGDRRIQKTERHLPSEGTSFPSKIETIFKFPPHYHFFAISHGVIPFRWQKEWFRHLELKITANSHWRIWEDHTASCWAAHQSCFWF